MLSKRTTVELINLIETFTHGDIDRIFSVFNLSHYIVPGDTSLSKNKKCNFLFRELEIDERGPFTDSVQQDMLEYAIETFNRIKKRELRILDEERLEKLLANEHHQLINCLKKDGFIVKNGKIRKALPAEIEEAKTESELVTLLERFKFVVARGHLEQAVDNYVNGNWAGANGQFRPFIESLLIEIAKSLLPGQSCTSATGAIKLLSMTVSPPFLAPGLNEVENSTCNKPFIEGFWKRLHPEGSHPGLSNEADATFRYHLCIVVAHYLLKRFEARLQ